MFACTIDIADRHALENLQSPRSEKKWGEKNSLRKRLAIFGLLDGLWLVGARFRRSANPRSCKKKVAVSPSLTVRGGQYHYTKMCNNRINGASGICEGDNFHRLVSTRDRSSSNRIGLPLRPQVTGN